LKSFVFNTPLRRFVRVLIRAYQLSFSAIFGRQCRYIPSCSEYADEAIERYGVWAGGWIGVSRMCRCHPWGGDGLDPVPADLPQNACWYLPWRLGRWSSRHIEMRLDAE